MPETHNDFVGTSSSIDADDRIQAELLADSVKLFAIAGQTLVCVFAIGSQVT